MKNLLLLIGFSCICFSTFAQKNQMTLIEVEGMASITVSATDILYSVTIIDDFYGYDEDVEVSVLIQNKAQFLVNMVDDLPDVSFTTTENNYEVNSIYRGSNDEDKLTYHLNIKNETALQAFVSGLRQHDFFIGRIKKISFQDGEQFKQQLITAACQDAKLKLRILLSIFKGKVGKLSSYKILEGVDGKATKSAYNALWGYEEALTSTDFTKEYKVKVRVGFETK